MISSWRRDLSPRSCKARPIRIHTGEAEVLGLFSLRIRYVSTREKRTDSKIDRSKITATNWHESLRRNNLNCCKD
jgi:hypothetical protein